MSGEFYYPLEITSIEDFNSATDPRKVLQEASTENKNQEGKAVPENFQRMEKVVDSYSAKQKIEEINKFVDAQKSKNTSNKTKSDINTWERFCASVGEVRRLSEIPPATLNELLGQFFVKIRKKDGAEYEPDTLTSLQRSIARKLKEQGSKFNILIDKEFQWSRDALYAKRKELVGQGRGNKPNACREVTLDEENKLFETGQFGCQEPLALQRTLWWFLSLHFGFRARDESRKLCWGDVSLENDPETGNEMLVWKAERGTKTRTGREGGHRREFNPKLQATNTERCPVRYYKLFASKRPESMLNPDSPFFLTVNTKKKNPGDEWYLNRPLGKNEIGNFLSKAAKSAGIQGNVKGHSVRKTNIGRLLDANFPEIFVSQLSGHKQVQSLRNYKHPSMIHQRQMSQTLSGGAKRLITSRGNEFPTASKITRREENHQVSLTDCPKDEVTPHNANVTDTSHMSFASQMFSAATLNNCTIQIMPGNVSIRRDQATESGSVDLNVVNQSG